MKRLFLFLLPLLLLGCNKTTDCFTVGFIAPLSGEQAAFGNNCLAAAELAVEEINAAGNIKIKLLTADDRGDPVEAVNAFYRLSAQKAAAIIGGVTSSVAVGLSSAANASKTVLLCPSATADSIDTEDDYVFRACFLDSYQGSRAAQFVASKGYKTAAVLFAAGDAYSAGLKDAFLAECRRLNISIVSVSAVSSPSETDYGPQLLRIADLAPEVLYAPLYYSSAGPFLLPQAHALGYRGLILGGDGFDGLRHYVKDSSLLDNVIFSNHYAADSPIPRTQDFVCRFTLRYGERRLGSFAALGYDAMHMLAAALSTPLPVREALKSLHFTGVTGSFTLDASGTPNKEAVFIGFNGGKEYTVPPC